MNLGCTFSGKNYVIVQTSHLAVLTISKGFSNELSLLFLRLCNRITIKYLMWLASTVNAEAHVCCPTHLRALINLRAGVKTSKKSIQRDL